MQDFADRTWCTQPDSTAWVDAARNARRAIMKAVLSRTYLLAADYEPDPRHVVIGCAHPDFTRPAMFARISTH